MKNQTQTDSDECKETNHNGYNSVIGQGIAITMALSVGMGGCVYLNGLGEYYSQKGNAEVNRQVQEMNFEGHKYKFYTIDEKPAVTDIDNEEIFEFIKKFSGENK